MMVGPSGSGKSSAWRVLLKALERLEGKPGVAHVIDPKAISKGTSKGKVNVRLFSTPNRSFILLPIFVHFLSFVF